jgi:hypothetical protein
MCLVKLCADVRVNNLRYFAEPRIDRLFPAKLVKFLSPPSSTFNDDIFAVQVTSVLNNPSAKEWDPSMRVSLCIEVLRTIAVLISNNQRNIDQFREFTGYDQLRHLILM